MKTNVVALRSGPKRATSTGGAIASHVVDRMRNENAKRRQMANLEARMPCGEGPGTDVWQQVSDMVAIVAAWWPDHQGVEDLALEIRGMLLDITAHNMETVGICSSLRTKEAIVTLCANATRFRIRLWSDGKADVVDFSLEERGAIRIGDSRLEMPK